MTPFFKAERPLAQSLIISIFLVALALLTQHYIEPSVGTILFLFLYPVVFFMAWIGGPQVGLFTIAISLISVDYFFIYPKFQIGHISTANAIRMVLFTLSNLLMVYIVYRLRKAEKEAMSLYLKVTESEENYKAIVELSPHIIWYSDKSGETTYLNQTWSEFTGLPPENFTENWKKTLHPEDYDKAIAAWRSASKSLEKYELPIRLRRYDGEYRWFLSRGKPVLNPDGTLFKWVGKAIEFHEQKLAMDLKDEFISLASHELKTPLTSLSLQLQILEKNVKSKNQKILNFESLQRLTKISLTQIEQINHLIEDMLEVSKISEGKLSYQMSTTNLNEVIENATEIVAGHFIDANIPLSVEGQDNLKVPADQRRLVQVLVNLLINALKYGGGSPVSIKISSDKTSKTAKIEVADSGQGISKENQKKIFDRFVQINSHSKNSGLGLGLYLSKEVINAHSGNLSVESDLNQGARFIIELPLSL